MITKDVVIVGTGFSGMGVAAKLLESGRSDFAVLEKADDVGGTWRDNTYPGCECDIPSHMYSFSWALNPDWSRNFSQQPEIWAYMMRTDGRLTALGPIGAPTMLLATIGRKSGAKRLSPLLFARDGGSLIVVGSNFGQDHHPAWTGNLLANPKATVKLGGKDVPVNAQLLEGAEAEDAYQKMNDVAAVYSVYRGRTARSIRVFRLTPASDA